MPRRDEPSKTDGKAEEIKGKAKQAWGDVTDNPDQQLEGKRREELGESEQARAELRDREREREEKRI